MLTRSWFLVLYSSLLAFAFAFFVHAAAADERGTKNKEPGTEIYRPKAGEFPPLSKAHAYRGELVFVDHANRRGSLRVEGTGNNGWLPKMKPMRPGWSQGIAIAPRV